jgi:hypothetical protein
MLDLAGLLTAVIALHLVVGLIVLIAARPQRGLLLLVALTPFNGLLLLAPDVGLLAGWKEALVLGTLAATFIAPASARAQSPLSWPSWFVPLAGFVVVGLASAVSVGGIQALVGLKLNFFYVLVLVIVVRCPFSRRERDQLVTVIMAVGVVTAAVGVWQQAVGGEALNQLGYEYDETIRTAGGLLRSFSTFNQPFPFGFYLMLVLLLGLPVALADLRRARNIVFLMTVPVLLVGMLSSIVRAAVLGFAVGAVWLWAHRYRHLAHLVPPTLAVLIFIPPSTLATLLSSSSLGERSAGWVRTVDEVLAAPFGNGIGSAGSASEKAAELAGLGESGYQPDNYYFKTVYELGPLGLWMLVLLFAGTFAWARMVSKQAQAVADAAAPRGPRRSWSRPSTDDRVLAQDAALAAGVAASILAAVVASFVAAYLEIFPIDLYFWLLLGVVTSLARTSSSAPSPSVRTAAESRPTSASSSGP